VAQACGWLRVGDEEDRGGAPAQGNPLGQVREAVKPVQRVVQEDDLRHCGVGRGQQAGQGASAVRFGQHGQAGVLQPGMVLGGEPIGDGQDDADHVW
jgi:hypothetical protein